MGIARKKTAFKKSLLKNICQLFLVLGFALASHIDQELVLSLPNGPVTRAATFRNTNTNPNTHDKKIHIKNKQTENQRQHWDLSSRSRTTKTVGVTRFFAHTLATAAVVCCLKCAFYSQSQVECFSTLPSSRSTSTVPEPEPAPDPDPNPPNPSPNSSPLAPQLPPPSAPHPHPQAPPALVYYTINPNEAGDDKTCGSPPSVLKSPLDIGNPDAQVNEIPMRTREECEDTFEKLKWDFESGAISKIECRNSSNQNVTITKDNLYPRMGYIWNDLQQMGVYPQMFPPGCWLSCDQKEKHQLGLVWNELTDWKKSDCGSKLAFQTRCTGAYIVCLNGQTQPPAPPGLPCHDKIIPSLPYRDSGSTINKGDDWGVSYSYGYEWDNGFYTTYTDVAYMIDIDVVSEENELLEVQATVCSSGPTIERRSREIQESAHTLAVFSADPYTCNQEQRAKYAICEGVTYDNANQKSSSSASPGKGNPYCEDVAGTLSSADLWTVKKAEGDLEEFFGCRLPAGKYYIVVGARSEEGKGGKGIGQSKRNQNYTLKVSQLVVPPPLPPSWPLPPASPCGDRVIQNLPYRDQGSTIDTGDDWEVGDQDKRRYRKYNDVAYRYEVPSASLQQDGEQGGADVFIQAVVCSNDTFTKTSEVTGREKIKTLHELAVFTADPVTCKQDQQWEKAICDSAGYASSIPWSAPNCGHVPGTKSSSDLQQLGTFGCRLAKGKTYYIVVGSLTQLGGYYTLKVSQFNNAPPSPPKQPGVICGDKVITNLPYQDTYSVSAETKREVDDWGVSYWNSYGDDDFGEYYDRPLYTRTRGGSGSPQKFGDVAYTLVLGGSGDDQQKQKHQMIQIQAVVCSSVSVSRAGAKNTEMAAHRIAVFSADEEGGCKQKEPWQFPICRSQKNEDQRVQDRESTSNFGSGVDPQCADVPGTRSSSFLPWGGWTDEDRRNPYQDRGTPECILNLSAGTYYIVVGATLKYWSGNYTLKVVQGEFFPQPPASPQPPRSPEPPGPPPSIEQTTVEWLLEGRYPNENSWRIIDNCDGGSTIDSGGWSRIPRLDGDGDTYGLSSPDGALVACLHELPSFTLEMIDEYGDGWDGAVLQFTFPNCAKNWYPNEVVFAGQEFYDGYRQNYSFGTGTCGETPDDSTTCWGCRYPPPSSPLASGG